MRLLLSGEGPTDIGSCKIPDPCSGTDFDAGPMAWLIDQIAARLLGYSSMALGFVNCVSEGTVHRRAKKLRGLRLAGKNRPKETAYHFRDARALAQLAQELAEDVNDLVVAVLFHDSDGTRSSDRDLWQNKWNSIFEGFSFESYDCGVPMVPKPKSEAWLLCALKSSQPYQHCSRLEQASGNDKSPNSLKDQLEAVLGEPGTREVLVGRIQDGQIDAFQITDMPSFTAFRKRLEAVLNSVLAGELCTA